MRATLAAGLIGLGLFGDFGDAWAEARKIVFVAPTSQDMPIAGYTHGVLTQGILKDFGELLAQRLGRQPEFVSLPSKRVSMAFAQGQVDAICYVLPAWIDGNFNWSKPLFPTAEVIVAQPTARPVTALADMAKVPVGTVLGYRHPRMENALGLDFVRDDAPTMELLFAKLVLGRSDYGIVDAVTLSYKQKLDKSLRLRTDMTLTTSVTQCAFSKLSSVPFTEVKIAIDSLVSDGTLDRIVAKYR